MLGLEYNNVMRNVLSLHQIGDCTHRSISITRRSGNHSLTGYPVESSYILQITLLLCHVMPDIRVSVQ